MKNRIDKNHWLVKKPVAHRGLWNKEITENSLSAYKNAVDNGYPIEIDVYSSKDGVIFSFHDASLTRMTGENGYIYEKTEEELKALTINEKGEKIPTLKQVLEVVNGKVPLLIEIKNQPRKDVAYAVLRDLDGYAGEYAIQSFNPMYINAVKKLAPFVLRGILATKSKNHLKKEKPFTRFVIKNMALNFLIKPDFISFNYEDLPLKKCKVKSRPVIAWTVTSKEIQDKISSYCDNIIFENYLPK